MQKVAIGECGFCSFVNVIPRLHIANDINEVDPKPKMINGPFIVPMDRDGGVDHSPALTQPVFQWNFDPYLVSDTTE
eukprot:gnl/Chilomastix_caulleri/6956.p1 GENE.gnl/Chilomastix_caulleri/6956~~gnl/Chilomastix_caulleri/6956.p1  ORF type:complete len:77 (+),score=6.09 gnl/Chilomastix_caulleri/6956:104-334(+)